MRGHLHMRGHGMLRHGKSHMMLMGMRGHTGSDGRRERDSYWWGVVPNDRLSRLRGGSGTIEMSLLPLRPRGRDMLACVILLDLDEVLLSVGAYLDDILGAYVALNLLPGAAVLLEGVEEELVLVVGPVLAVLCDDVLLAGLLSGRGGGGLVVVAVA